MKNIIRIIFIIFVILSTVILFTGCDNIIEIIQENTKSANESETEEDDELQEYKELQTGDTAPNFSVELLSGKTVKLSDYRGRGKIVFLNFWAAWCGPCVGEMPDIQKLSDAFPDDLVVIAINCSEKKNKVEDFINDNGYTFNVGIDENGKIQNKYPTMGIPYTVIMDAEGIITAIQTGAGGDMFSIYEEYVKTALGG